VGGLDVIIQPLGQCLNGLGMKSVPTFGEFFQIAGMEPLLAATGNMGMQHICPAPACFLPECRTQFRLHLAQSMQGNNSDDTGCFSISICHISSAMIVAEHIFYFNTNPEIRVCLVRPAWALTK
jgi:hypothetical protein